MFLKKNNRDLCPETSLKQMNPAVHGRECLLCKLRNYKLAQFGLLLMRFAHVL